MEEFHPGIHGSHVRHGLSGDSAQHDPDYTFACAKLKESNRVLRELQSDTTHRHSESLFKLCQLFDQFVQPLLSVAERQEYRRNVHLAAVLPNLNLKTFTQPSLDERFRTTCFLMRDLPIYHVADILVAAGISIPDMVYTNLTLEAEAARTDKAKQVSSDQVAVAAGVKVDVRTFGQWFSGVIGQTVTMVHSTHEILLGYTVPMVTFVLETLEKLEGFTWVPAPDTTPVSEQLDAITGILKGLESRMDGMEKELHSTREHVKQRTSRDRDDTDELDKSNPTQDTES